MIDAERTSMPLFQQYITLHSVRKNDSLLKQTVMHFYCWRHVQFEVVFVSNRLQLQYDKEENSILSFYRFVTGSKAILMAKRAPEGCCTTAEKSLHPPANMKHG